MPNAQIIMSALAAVGVDLLFIEDSQMDDAIAGKPALFHIHRETISNCYNNYREIVVNYDPEWNGNPISNWGKVTPKEIYSVNGIRFAIFDYNVDSSG